MVTSVVAVTPVTEPSDPVVESTAVTGMVKVLLWVENEVNVTGTPLLFEPTVTVTVVGLQYDSSELEDLADDFEDEAVSRVATLSSCFSLSDPSLEPTDCDDDDNGSAAKEEVAASDVIVVG